MEQWSSNGRSYDIMSRSSWTELFGGVFALDNLRCSPDAWFLDDCSYNPIGHHDCSYSEGLWLKCSMEDDGMDLDGMNVELQKVNGAISSNGTVVLREGNHTSGLVCADGVNARTAELLCNEAGYDYLVDYNAAKNVNSSDKLDCDTMRDRHISVIAEDLNCTSNSTELGDCSAAVASGDCDADDALWLSCTNDNGPEWVLTKLTMAYNEAGHHGEGDASVGGRYGTVVAFLQNQRTGLYRVGLVPYTGSSWTRSSMCYMTGYTNRYPEYSRTGQISDNANTKLSCGFLLEHEISVVLSYFWCPTSYSDISACQFTLADDHVPSNSDAMWLSC